MSCPDHPPFHGVNLGHDTISHLYGLMHQNSQVSALAVQSERSHGLYYLENDNHCLDLCFLKGAALCLSVGSWSCEQYSHRRVIDSRLKIVAHSTATPNSAIRHFAFGFLCFEFCHWLLDLTDIWRDRLICMKSPSIKRIQWNRRSAVVWVNFRFNSATRKQKDQSQVGSNTPWLLCHRSQGFALWSCWRKMQLFWLVLWDAIRSCHFTLGHATIDSRHLVRWLRSNGKRGGSWLQGNIKATHLICE